MIVGLAFAGVAVYSVINIILGFLVLILASDSNSGASSTAVIAVGAAVLALIGLGAGVGLLFVRKPWATGAGLGLMIGWALWSIVSAGYCTGLNPGLYV